MKTIKSIKQVQLYVFHVAYPVIIKQIHRFPINTNNNRRQNKHKALELSVRFTIAIIRS